MNQPPVVFVLTGLTADATRPLLAALAERPDLMGATARDLLRGETPGPTCGPGPSPDTGEGYSPRRPWGNVIGQPAGAGPTVGECSPLPDPTPPAFSPVEALRAENEELRSKLRHAERFLFQTQSLNRGLRDRADRLEAAHQDLRQRFDMVLRAVGLGDTARTPSPTDRG